MRFQRAGDALDDVGRLLPAIKRRQPGLHLAQMQRVQTACDP